MPKLLPKPEYVEVRTDAEKMAVHEGVRIYLKNLKAAVGTATGLGDTGIADMWKERAEHIEQGLLARLNEQIPVFSDGVGPMPLATAGAGK